MIETLVKLFQRDLELLKTEISSFKDEMNLWKISGDIKNSAGNLCLHLCGNLQHFIGAVLGNSEYVRNRDAEFSRKDVPIVELVAEIELTKNVVQRSFEKLTEDDLKKSYPINAFWLRNDNRIFAYKYGYTFHLSPWANQLSPQITGYLVYTCQ